MFYLSKQKNHWTWLFYIHCHDKKMSGTWFYKAELNQCSLFQQDVLFGDVLSNAPGENRHNLEGSRAARGWSVGFNHESFGEALKARPSISWAQWDCPCASLITNRECAWAGVQMSLQCLWWGVQWAHGGDFIAAPVPVLSFGAVGLVWWTPGIWMLN